MADIISVVQQNTLQWYGHVLQKEDNDWVKKCMEYEVQGVEPGGRPKKTWRLWKKLSGARIEQGGCQGTGSPGLFRTKFIEMPQIHPQNCPFPFNDQRPSNTPIP